jgi:hypothetical protein
MVTIEYTFWRKKQEAWALYQIFWNVATTASLGWQLAGVIPPASAQTGVRPDGRACARRRQLHRDALGRNGTVARLV